MATISFKGLDEYRDVMMKLQLKTDFIIKPAVYEGAAIVVEEVKKSLDRVTSSQATGDLRESIGLSPMENDNGFINTKLGFEGYDRKGDPNIVKARALESGTSKQQKKPFIRPAVNKVRAEAENRMAVVVSKQIEKLLDEKE